MRPIKSTKNRTTLIDMGVNFILWGCPPPGPNVWSARTSKFRLLLRYGKMRYFYLFPIFLKQSGKDPRRKMRVGGFLGCATARYRYPPIVDEGTPNHFEKLTTMDRDRDRGKDRDRDGDMDTGQCIE